MSMETPVFGAIRPPPESCDERGKWLKREQEPESESEPESQPESESDSDSEVEPRPNWDWELKPLEDLTVSDFSSFEDHSTPFHFSCRRFVYKNKAQREKEAEEKKARDEYLENSRNLSPFDAIPIPLLAMTCSCNWARPVDITDDKRLRLTHLSKLALDNFNADIQAKYEFVELVKATRRPYPVGTYYITFKAKPKDATDVDASNCPATTFQSHVQDSSSVRREFANELPVVKSCSIKT